MTRQPGNCGRTGKTGIFLAVSPCDTIAEDHTGRATLDKRPFASSVLAANYKGDIVEASIVNVDNSAARSNAKGMKGWMKFIGILSIIGGILQALTIVGILFAWVPIWMGIVLTGAGSRAQEYADKGDAASLTAFTGKLKTYFTISGILIIISIALGIVGGIISVIMMAMGFSPAWSSLLDSIRNR